MKNSFSFECTHTDSRTHARAGVIHTPHGDIQTPSFIPVGTQASVKCLTPDDLNTLDVQIYFVNTYHMYLRPGIDVVKKLGGLHQFMQWDKPLITDSGGFQVFSLNQGKDSELVKGPLVKISEDGVEFRSHWDGSPHMFTPESSMEWQWDLGADIHIAFDDCTSYPATHDTARTSMERTHRWALRSLTAHKACRKKKYPLYQALYGSIQGSVYEDLRQESAKFISSLDVDGIAIGGVAVGESKKQMGDVLTWVTPLLPENKPRHLLGVGEIDDIFSLVEHGVDTFDCVTATRKARTGTLLIGADPSKKHSIDITKAQYASDSHPIEEGCTCYTCQHFSRAYIHHLFHVHELVVFRLATIHNIFCIQRLVHDIRESILDNSFIELKKQWL
jgi:queuine tRNA-ribosyltransferase